MSFGFWRNLIIPLLVGEALVLKFECKRLNYFRARSINWKHSSINIVKLSDYEQHRNLWMHSDCYQGSQKFDLQDYVIVYPFEVMGLKSINKTSSKLTIVQLKLV